MMTTMPCTLSIGVNMTSSVECYLLYVMDTMKGWCHRELSMH